MVLADYDIDQGRQTLAAFGAFIGQRARLRLRLVPLFVAGPGGLLDEFVEKVKAEGRKAIRIGDPFDPATRSGTGESRRGSAEQRVCCELGVRPPKTGGRAW